MSDFIPFELMTEILTRLPVKSLLKFRCVCKEWCFLIPSPSFTSKHLSNYSKSSHYNNNTLVRHYSKLYSKEIYTLYNNNSSLTEKVQTTRVPFPRAGGKSTFYSRVVGYCNGVLCLSDDLFEYNETVILWNPSVRRAINVPSPNVTLNLYGNYVFALGFGFDYVNNDFKIVRLAYFMDEGYKIPPVVEVFSVLSGKWRRVKGKIPSFVITEHFWSQAVREGVVHWIGFVPSGKVHGRNLIVKYDLSKDVFGEMSLPDCLANVPVFNVVAKMLTGLLSVFRYDNRKTSCENCAIWVMREYGNTKSWVNRYNVRLEGGLGMVLGMPRDGEIVFSARDGELVVYDCASSTTKRTGICGIRLSFFVDKYVESLYLLGKGREVRGRDPKPDYEDEDELIEEEEGDKLKVTLTFIIGKRLNTRLN